jgi:hypothetical protein
MDKMTGDDEMLVDIDLDLPANVAAASGWVAPDIEDEKPAGKVAKNDAGADPLPSKELEDARRAAQEAQARLDTVSKQAQAERAERLKAQEEVYKNQTYALNAHLARMDANVARVQADHDQLATSLGAWKSHVDMAKRQLQQAQEVGDAKAQAEMTAQLAEAHAMIAQLEAGRVGAARDIEQAKRDREAAIRAAQAAAERAQEDTKQKEKAPQAEAPTPDDFVQAVRSKIGDHAAEWFKTHREFITDERLHKRMQHFVEDWVDRNGEDAIRTSKFTEALDDRFGFAKKAAPAPAPAAEEEDDMEDEKPTRTPGAPAAPVSRGNSVGKAPGTTGSKVRLSSDEAATAALMYPELSPGDARKKYATNKARLIADGRL